MPQSVRVDQPRAEGWDEGYEGGRGGTRGDEGWDGRDEKERGWTKGGGSCWQPPISPDSQLALTNPLLFMLHRYNKVGCHCPTCSALAETVLHKLGPGVFCRQIGPQTNWHRANWALANWAPENQAPGKLGPCCFFQANCPSKQKQKLYSKILFQSIPCRNTETKIHKFTYTQILHIIIGSVHRIQIYALGNINQLNLYIGVGYIPPTIGGYISIYGCLCAGLGNDNFLNIVSQGYVYSRKCTIQTPLGAQFAVETANWAPKSEGPNFPGLRRGAQFAWNR